MTHPAWQISNFSCPALESHGMRFLILSFTFLIGTAQRSLAAEAGGPATIYVEGLAELANSYVFYVYRPEWKPGKLEPSKPFWSRVRIERAANSEEPGAHIEPPASTGTGGKLGMLAVAKDVADKTPDGDPSWFPSPPAGVYPVQGIIDFAVLHRSHGDPILRYRLEKSADEFRLTLLNPDRLAHELDPDPAPVQSKPLGTADAPQIIWFALAAVALVLLVVAALWWRRSAAKRG
jgi:hypothetical protein